MQRHHFFAGPHRTHDGRPICESCGGVASAKVHDVPPVPADAVELEQRKLGETGVLS